jgi:protein pelota
MEFVHESTTFSKTSDIGAILIDNGSANAYYIKNNFSLHQGKIEKSLPRKKTGLMTFYSKALEGFYDKCFEMINNIFDINSIKCFIIAGPGTTPENFLNFIKKKSELKEYVFVRKNISKFIMAKASSSQGGSLTEVLEDPAIQNLISNTRAIKETKMLQTFMEMIR